MSILSSLMIFGIAFMFFLYVCARLAESESASHHLGGLFRKLAERPLSEKLFILVFVVMMVAHGGSKPTNSVPEGGGENTVVVVDPGTVEDGTGTSGVMTGDGFNTNRGGVNTLTGLEPQRLTTNQYAAGFALLPATVTNAAPWLAVPSNAVVHAPWTRYGVAEDTFWLPATNWGFVLGTNAIDGVHVSSSGTLSFGMPKGSPRAAGMPDGTDISFLAALQGPLGIVPPGGKFWHATTPSNSVLFTWQDVYAGRDTNSPVTFQTELFWNGDFTCRYAFTNALALTNFVVGAQYNGGGETYALDAANRLVNGLELRWRAFGVLDPGVDDHDNDGLSTYEEVMTRGTDPSNADSDGDGFSDSAELDPETGTNPADPDTDRDGLADGIDPQPMVENNAQSDSDGDGYPLWQELFYGTLDTVAGDVAQKFDAGSRSVTFTVSGTIPPRAVLSIGGFPVTLAGRQQFSLLFVPDTELALALVNATGVSVAVTSAGSIVLASRSGGFASGGSGAGTASLTLPAVEFGGGGILCLHGGDANLTVRVTADLPGSFYWGLSDGTRREGNQPGISQSGVPSGNIAVDYWPDGGNGPACVCNGYLSRCKRGGICNHGNPWVGCPICDDIHMNNDYWCYEHNQPFPVCACITTSGSPDCLLSPGVTTCVRIGDESDTNPLQEEKCCDCPEHALWGAVETKTNIVRYVTSRLKLYRDAGCVDEASEGARLDGPTSLTVLGAVPSTRFDDAWAAFSHELHPDEADWATVAFTVAGVGLGPDSLSAEGRYLIKGGMGCTARVDVVTQSNLIEGSVGLDASGGLFFSDTQGTPAASALTGLTNGPPGTVTPSRGFWLGATNGGLHTLSYALCLDDNTPYYQTNITVEVVMAKFATNAYYVAYGSIGLLTVDLDPVSHDAAGFELYLDGAYVDGEGPQWYVDTSCLTAGVHTLTVKSETFPDLEDSATLNVLKVVFIKLSETANPANYVFNATPKDDPPEIPMNMLYVVESLADSLYHVKVEVDDQPASARNKLMYAVYTGGSKLPTGEGFSPLSGPININFNHPMGSSTFVTDFEIKVGYDLNGNSSLDTNEILNPLEVKNATGEVIGPPTVRGASDVRYTTALGVVAVGTVDFLVPHASKLLQLFYDGGPGGLPSDKQPTSSGTINVNSFSGSFSEWLTHNSGAAFSSGGAATIPYHQWNIATSLANLVGESHQIKQTAEDYYNTTVASVVEAYFLTNPVGHVATFPPSPTDYYNIPHNHESPEWVPATTVTFDEPLQVNGINDDVNGTIGRGRLLYHKAKFIVEKKSLMGVEWLDMIQANYLGEVDDLYDFNQEAGGPAGESAIVQIGYGDGTYGRSAGVIYRSHIIFDVLIDDPF